MADTPPIHVECLIAPFFNLAKQLPRVISIYPRCSILRIQSIYYDCVVLNTKLVMNSLVYRVGEATTTIRKATLGSLYNYYQIILIEIV